MTKKLRGSAFFESIGRPQHALAPMVEQSDFAWRLLTRSFLARSEASGTDGLVCYSPMMHARQFLTDKSYRERNFQALRTALPLPTDSPAAANGHDQQPYLDGNPKIDRPLFVQFCANDPSTLLQAARFVEPYCDAVDLNLGCPQGIAKDGHYGAFLQEDWPLIFSLIRTLHDNLSIPVTAKIRILESKERTLEYAKMVVEAGASILTVHGRQRHQKAQLTGLADWDTIKYLRQNLPHELPMFANGNILQHDDLHRCREATQVNGVMSAEGNLGNPAIFSSGPQTAEDELIYWRGDGQFEGGWRMDGVFRRFLDIIYSGVLGVPPPKRSPLFQVQGLNHSADECLPSMDWPEQEQAFAEAKKHGKTSPSIRNIQRHLFPLLHPLLTKHTYIRDAVAKTRIANMAAFEHVLSLTEKVIRDALIEYHVNGNREVANHADNIPYARPWWVCQARLRPLPEQAIANGSITVGKKNRKLLDQEVTLGDFSSLTEGIEAIKPAVPDEGLVSG